MDSLNPENPPITVTPTEPPPRIWQFWGTALWGLFVFGGMFVGQLTVIAYFVLMRDGPIDVATAFHVVGGGRTISLSVVMGLPAVILALGIAIRPGRRGFGELLAVRGVSWKVGIIAVVAVVGVV